MTSISPVFLIEIHNSICYYISTKERVLNGVLWRSSKDH